MAYVATTHFVNCSFTDVEGQGYWFKRHLHLQHLHM